MSGPFVGRIFHRVDFATGQHHVVSFDDLGLGDVFVIDDDGVVRDGVWRVTGRVGEAIQCDPVDEAAKAIVAAREAEKGGAL